MNSEMCQFRFGAHVRKGYSSFRFKYIHLYPSLRPTWRHLDLTQFTVLPLSRALEWCVAGTHLNDVFVKQFTWCLQVMISLFNVNLVLDKAVEHVRKSINYLGHRVVAVFGGWLERFGVTSRNFKLMPIMSGSFYSVLRHSVFFFAIHEKRQNTRMNEIFKIIGHIGAKAGLARVARWRSPVTIQA